MAQTKKTAKAGKTVTTAKKTTVTALSQGAYVKKNKASYNTDQWVAFVTVDDKAKSPRLYPSYLTRDEVRNAYSKENGVKFQVTRSRRVKNF